MRLDHQWIEDQLEGSGLTTSGKEIARGLLAVLESSDIPNQIAENTLESVLPTVHSLALGHPIQVEEDEFVWVPVILGEIFKRDTVKIKPDAYNGEHGIRFNGKIGRVVATSGLNISVILDGEDVESVVKHHPDNLLKKM